MATKGEMVSPRFPYSGYEDISGMQGALHIGRPDQGSCCQGTEPGGRSPHSTTKRQPTESCVQHDLFDVVSPTRDSVRNGEDTKGMAANKYNIGDIASAEWGSGARANANKTRMDLVPLHLLASCADVFEYGAHKYATWNWAKGMPWSVPYGCMLRHLSAWYMGEDIDPESGKSHLGHVMANLLMLEHYTKAYKQGDDRPARWFFVERESS